MSNSSLTLIPNDVIGSIISATLQAGAYKQATQPMSGSNDYIPTVYWLNTIPFTAITQEIYQLTAEVTQHAVESGVIFSDHMILQPLRIEMEFEVSNCDGLGSQAQLAKTSLTNAITLGMNRNMFTLTTTHTQLKNMVCLNVRAINEAPNWGKIGFRATFQQVNLVTLSTTTSYPTGQIKGAIGANTAPMASSNPGGPVTPYSAMDSAQSVQNSPQPVTSTAPVFAPQPNSPSSSAPQVNHLGTGSWFGVVNTTGASR